MTIRIKPVKCPGCGAPIVNQSGRPQIYCSYCGQQLIIDDGVKRSEHTYRKIDEARIREAEARIKVAEAKERQEAIRAKQEAERARRKAAEARRVFFSQILFRIFPIFLPLISIAILLFSCRAMYGVLKKSNEEWALERAEEDAIQESKENNISSQILPICKNNGATIEHLSVGSVSVQLTILASNGSKESIDTLQNEIVNSLVLEEGLKAHIDFNYPQYNTLRWIEIDKFGQVKVIIDKTNSISEEECKKILKDYEEAITPILADYKAELLSNKYEGDVLHLHIKSSTSKKNKIDNLTNDIVDMNQSHKSLAIEIRYENKSGDTLREVEIDSDNTINIKEDHTN